MTEADCQQGETEWTLSGRYTGRSDIPLTANGEKQIISSSRIVFGPGRIIDPSRLAHIFISPRTRAHRTYELIFDDATRQALEGKVEITDDIREWDYGVYEGLLPGEIREGRRERGLDRERAWDIWLDGCEGGESPGEMAKRLDPLIARIKEIQKPCMHGERSADVVIIGHGHSLRAFAKRWVGLNWV